jgi:sodium/proline symporter
LTRDASVTSYPVTSQPLHRIIVTASTPTIVTFLIYIAIMLLIGYWAWRRTHTFDDFILGGRSLSPMVTALSTGASDMSGWLLMGLPGALFLSGASES